MHSAPTPPRSPRSENPMRNGGRHAFSQSSDFMPGTALKTASPRSARSPRGANPLHEIQGPPKAAPSSPRSTNPLHALILHDGQSPAGTAVVPSEPRAATAHLRPTVPVLSLFTPSASQAALSGRRAASLSHRGATSRRGPAINPLLRLPYAAVATDAPTHPGTVPTTAGSPPKERPSSSYDALTETHRAYALPQHASARPPLSARQSGVAAEAAFARPATAREKRQSGANPLARAASNPLFSSTGEGAMKARSARRGNRAVNPLHEMQQAPPATRSLGGSRVTPIASARPRPSLTATAAATTIAAAVAESPSISRDGQGGRVRGPPAPGPVPPSAGDSVAPRRVSSATSMPAPALMRASGAPSGGWCGPALPQSDDSGGESPSQGDSTDRSSARTVSPPAPAAAIIIGLTPQHGGAQRTGRGFETPEAGMDSPFSPNLRALPQPQSALMQVSFVTDRRCFTGTSSRRPSPSLFADVPPVSLPRRARRVQRAALRLLLHALCPRLGVRGGRAARARLCGNLRLGLGGPPTGTRAGHCSRCSWQGPHPWRSKAPPPAAWRRRGGAAAAGCSCQGGSYMGTPSEAAIGCK